MRFYSGGDNRASAAGSLNPHPVLRTASDGSGKMRSAAFAAAKQKPFPFRHLAESLSSSYLHHAKKALQMQCLLLVEINTTKSNSYALMQNFVG